MYVCVYVCMLAFLSQPVYEKTCLRMLILKKSQPCTISCCARPTLQDVSSYHIWSQTALSLSDRVLVSLGLIQDSLLHKATLRKRQVSDNCHLHLWEVNVPVTPTFLNNCPKALRDRRYTWRHDSILNKLYQFIIN